MILIADDEAEAADILGIFLEMSLPGVAVCVTYGGEQALEQASRQRPDVAVLDIEMPGMDGEALAHALRAMYPDQAPLLVALSGNLMRLEQARGAGAFDQFLSKPTDVEALAGMLGEWTARRGVDH